VTGTPLPDGVAAELVRLALSDPGNPNLHLLSLVKQDLVARFPLQTAAEALARLCGKNPFHIRSLPLAGMRDYVSEAGLAYSEVISAPKTFVIREPKILGASRRGSIEAVGRTIFMGAVEDAIVRPRSSLVETGGVLLLDTQDDELDAVKIVFEYDPHVLYGTDNNITLLDSEPGSASLYLPEAIHLGGVTSFAFGHWILEYLIKFFGALRSGILPRVPILIDEGMPASHRQALSLFLADEDFPIVEVRQGTIVAIKKLWLLSTWTYAPYFPRPKQDLGPKRLSPPPAAYASVLHWMRERLPTSRGTSSRVFLRRRADEHRRMMNADQIESVASKLGFALHDPGEHGFGDQLSLVKDATAIAGPDGSAVLLVLFSTPGRKVTILNNSFSEGVSTFSNVFEELGHDVLIVQGQCVRRDEDYLLFSDYEIAEEDFVEAVSR
jgi:capsular polysaccharide biosynthesis protein